MDLVTNFARPLLGWEPHRVPLQNGDLLFWGRRQRFVAIFLDGDIVALDYKKMCSWRVRQGNWQPESGTRFCRLKEAYLLDCDTVKEILAASHDNPYTLWNIILAIPHGRLSDLMPLPPLEASKNPVEHKVRFDKMVELSDTGDLLFQYDRSSWISRAIRTYDKGMWSHCGIISERGKMIHATPSGLIETRLDESIVFPMDAALYRVEPPPTLAQRAEMVQYARERLGTGYNWRGVIRIFLSNRFGIPYRRRPSEFTLSDLTRNVRSTLLAYV